MTLTIDGLIAQTDSNEHNRSEREENPELSYLVKLQTRRRSQTRIPYPGGIGGEEEFFVYTRLARHVGPEYPFYGLKARSAKGKEPSQPSVQEIASDYLREIRPDNRRGLTSSLENVRAGSSPMRSLNSYAQTGKRLRC